MRSVSGDLESQLRSGQATPQLRLWRPEALSPVSGRPRYSQALMRHRAESILRAKSCGACSAMMYFSRIYGEVFRNRATGLGVFKVKLELEPVRSTEPAPDDFKSVRAACWPRRNSSSSIGHMTTFQNK